MKKVIIIGATGSLAQYVIEALQKLGKVVLTLFARSSITSPLNEGNSTVKADVMDYDKLKNAIAGQDIVYVNLAGNLEAMIKNIVKAMNETGVRRIIAISSIGIYEIPLKSILVPYRKLADVIEASGWIILFFVRIGSQMGMKLTIDLLKKESRKQGLPFPEKVLLHLLLLL